jgi:DNA-binding transcriptional MerR regulator
MSVEPGSGAAWTAGQVARHLGIAESTLRSWHRRYNIGPHGSEPGRYRRYSEADVARLRRMLELIKLGMLASDAARTVEAGEPEAVSPERDVADLVAAARATDSERCGVVLDNIMTRRGVVEAWETVCRPALAIVDAAQNDDPDCMDIEHALSWAMLGALHRVPRPPIAPGTGVVLLACVESEHHTLPLAALAAALASYRIPVRMLGAATPTQSLVRAVRDIGPAAVVLWSQRQDTAGLRVLQLLPFPLLLLAAGPGWPAAGVESIEYLTGLRHALSILVGTPADPADPADPGDPDDPDGFGGPDGPGGDAPDTPPQSPPAPQESQRRPSQESQPPYEARSPGQPAPPSQHRTQIADEDRLDPPGSLNRRYPPFPTDASTSLQ